MNDENTIKVGDIVSVHFHGAQKTFRNFVNAG